MVASIYPIIAARCPYSKSVAAPCTQHSWRQLWGPKSKLHCQCWRQR